MAGEQVSSQLLFMAKDTNEPSPYSYLWLTCLDYLQVKFLFSPAVLAKNPDFTI